MSSIPAFNHNNVLPPYLKTPTAIEDQSPYECTTLELCKTFATTIPRITILKKYIEFRTQLNNFGVIFGFQWLDGSFVEDIEKSQKRAPRDLDIVTFFGDITNDRQNEIAQAFPAFYNPIISKAHYHLDHYLFDFCYSPINTVKMTQYWIQLFTHNKENIWKGILQIDLNTPIVDKEALNYINALENVISPKN
jgi:hypothetical protein